jgi:hypothetical protein
MRTLAVAILSLSLAVGFLAVDALGRPRKDVPPSPAICTAPPGPSPVLGPPTPPGVVGISTWFDASKNSAWYTRKTTLGDPIVFYAAAGPKLRDYLGDPDPYLEKYPVLITNVKNGRTILVVVVDWCSCSKGGQQEKLIDLSPAAFVALGVPLSRGIQKVYVRLP